MMNRLMLTRLHFMKEGQLVNRRSVKRRNTKSDVYIWIVAFTQVVYTKAKPSLSPHHLQILIHTFIATG